MENKNKNNPSYNSIVGNKMMVLEGANVAVSEKINPACDATTLAAPDGLPCGDDGSEPEIKRIEGP